MADRHPGYSLLPIRPAAPVPVRSFRRSPAMAKASEFIARMHRILALYGTPPTDGRVICVDAFGPLNLMPRRDPFMDRLPGRGTRCDRDRQLCAARR